MNKVFINIPTGFIRLHTTRGTVRVININAIAMIVPEYGNSARIYLSYGIARGGGTGYGLDETSFLTQESYQQVVDAINSAQR